MARLTFDITMSLDGYVAGPNMTPDKGLGEGGEELHNWAFDTAAWQEEHGRTGGEDNVDSKVVEESVHNIGARIMGRRMFGGEGEWDNKAWGDQPWQGWWGDEPPFHTPVFVLTTHPREPLVKGETTFTFVTDGIESRARAGPGRRRRQGRRDRRRGERGAAVPEAGAGGRLPGPCGAFVPRAGRAPVRQPRPPAAHARMHARGALPGRHPPALPRGPVSIAALAAR